MSPAAAFTRILLPESLRSSSLEANGSGWSCNYDCLLYSCSIRSFSSFLQDWYPTCPSLHTLKHGFLLRIRSFHILNPVYLDDLFILESNCIVMHLPPSHLSSLQNVNSFVQATLTMFGVPTTDRDSLVRLLFSFGCRHEESSASALVPLYLDFNVTTVLRNTVEATDWLSGGTMNTVVVKTLRATYEEILELKKTSFDGALSKAENCMVCLEGFKDGKEVSRLPCLHEYHHGCIAEWLKHNHRCPICRSPMPWVHTMWAEDSTSGAL